MPGRYRVALGRERRPGYGAVARDGERVHGDVAGGTDGSHHKHARPADLEAHSGRLEPRCRPSCPAVQGFHLLRVDVRASLRLTRVLWAEITATREHVTPEYAARDVGTLQAGIRFESDLGRGAAVWASAAVIPLARSNTQTASGLGTDVGLGARIQVYRRWHLGGSYFLLRVNRLGVQSSITSLSIGLQ